MAKVAVVLSGCGFQDGAEIRESVIALLELDKAGADVTCFAPDINQTKVVNHLNGEDQEESRNVLVESARIARGVISDLANANADDFDALILPGGFGAALNLSDLAIKGANATVLPEFKNFVLGFIESGKPIGAICISPAVLVAVVHDKISPTLTIGKDQDNLIVNLGGKHEDCATENAVVDDAHKIASCPAYMQDAPLSKVAAGIEKVVGEVLRLVG